MHAHTLYPALRVSPKSAILTVRSLPSKQLRAAMSLQVGAELCAGTRSGNCLPMDYVLAVQVRHSGGSVHAHLRQPIKSWSRQQRGDRLGQAYWRRDKP